MAAKELAWRLERGEPDRRFAHTHSSSMQPTPVDPEFVLQHAAHVRALAARLVFDGTRAEDLAQETWLAALRNAPQSMTSPRGWLARIAQRRAVQDWRTESARAAREQTAARAEGVASESEVLEREELRTRIVRAVLALEEPYRSAIVAQFLEERTPRDAAQRRGVPVETQRTHVKRGLELLRQRTRQELGGTFAAFQLALVRDLRLEAPASVTFAAASSGLVIGGLTMWTAKKAAIAAAVMLAVLLGVTRPWESNGLTASGIADRQEPLELVGSGELSEPHAEDSTRQNIESANAIPISVQSSSSSSSSGIVVLARVVDESGRPIPGASGVLVSRGGWKGAQDPRATFEAVTGDDGVLRIELPVLTTERADLTVTADPYRTRALVRFDASAMRVLRAGTNDVGELVLGPAGRIIGRVLADDRPLQGARIATRARIASRNPGWGESGEDGRFVLAHVDPSETALDISRIGLVDYSTNVTLHAGRDTDVGDVVLERAPSIAGTLVDREGAPCAGVPIRARSVEGNVSGDADSDADGRFRVYVPASGAYDLAVHDSRQYLSWGGADAPGARFETGEESAQIVLTAIALTTFRIVEAGTEKPMLEFGLGVRKVGMSGSPLGEDEGDFVDTWPRITAQSSNESTQPAQPGLHDVFVAAPGHVPLWTPVLHDAITSPIQTIHLERGHALRGRVVRAGSGLAGVQVLVERAFVPLGPRPERPGSIELGRTHARDVSAFAGRARDVITGENGTFEFVDLPSGTFDLRTVLAGVPGARLDLVRVPPDADVDVGDIVLGTGVTIRGVLDAGSNSAIGWSVAVLGSAGIVIDRADGRFELSGLSSGSTLLQWFHSSTIGLERESMRTKDAERSMELLLAEGEVRDVHIDIADSSPARVTLHVFADGEPVEGATPWAIELAPEAGRSSSRNETKSDGSWTGLFRPGTEYMFQAILPEGMLLANSEPILLVAGEHSEVRLEGRTGSLEVDLPASLQMPDEGFVSLEVTPRGGRPHYISLNRWYRGLPQFAQRGRVWNGSRFQVGRCGVGEWMLHVEVCRMFPGSGTSWSSEPLIPRVEVPITIRAGEATVVALPDH